ncbi:DNA mismatch repair endonuclease MutL [PVC group bacterium]|nr:DNA mismatch repair endonuclease MutL [PVC group bacterium]
MKTLKEKIRVLPEQVANKIAAGEVIARPASVVKELVENSLDAGATKISVEIRSYGLGMIRVTDNGRGMSREDLEMAFLRHATSKIQSDKDLNNIQTFGFRGEALPSIAAVSFVQAVSCEESSHEAWQGLIEGGCHQALTQVNPRCGTEITVTRLFFNTPARKKFLKTPGTEFGHIIKVMEKVLLSHPEISLSLHHDQKKTMIYEANGLKMDFLMEVMGREFFEKNIEISSEFPSIKVRGFISDPSLTRPNRAHQYFFVNKRPIRSIGLSIALSAAYQTLIPHGRFPMAVIYLDVDFSRVDVNVHPTKDEVRFDNERDIQNCLIRALRDRISGFRSVIQNSSSSIPQERRQQIADAVASYGQHNRVDRQPVFEKSPPTSSPGTKSDGIEDLFRTRRVCESWDADDISEEKVFQMNNSYIFLKLEDGFIVFDQHAACERIHFERIKKKYREKEVGCQTLLIPLKIDLSPSRKALLEAHQDLFKKLKIKVEPFGSDEYAITEISDFLPKDINVNGFLSEIFDLIESDKNIAENPLRSLELIYYTMACHASRRLRENLTKREMVQICQDLLELETPFTCPHGRPVGVKITWANLNKMFYRSS